MKNKLFDRKCYCEALRQTRSIGLIAIILSVLIPLLTGITSILSQTLRRGFSPAMSNAQVVNLLEIGFILYGIIYLFAPLLAGKLFQFLNHRVSCDFYHAIPQTRQCLFFCNYAAVLTWIAAAIAGSTLCCIALTGFASDFLIMNWNSVLPTVFGVFAGSILSASAVILGITLTGTPLMNTVVTLMILFVPRLFISTFVNLIGQNIALLSQTHFLPLLSEPLNIVFSASAGNSQAGLYSLILGLLYGGLALLFFVRRRSEAAGNATPGHKLQVAFRTVFTLICCLPAIYTICLFLLSGSEDIADILPSSILLFSVAVIAYFLFELVTTRRVRNLLLAIPELLIVALANVLIIGSVLLTAQFSLAYTPAPEEIDSVAFELGNEYSSSVADRYLFSNNRSVFFSDADLIRSVSETLADNVSVIRESGNHTAVLTSVTHYRVTVAIRHGNQTTYRNLYFIESDYKMLLTRIGNNPIMHDLYSRLPALDQSVLLTGWPGNGSQSYAKDIYESLRQAMLTADFKENHAVMTNDTSTYPYLSSFFIVATSGTDKASMEVPLLYCDAFEEAARMYLDEEVRFSADIAPAFLSAIESGKINMLDARILCKPSDGDDAYYTITDNSAMQKELAAYLRRSDVANSDSGIYLVLDGRSENEKYESADSYYYSCYFRIDSVESVQKYFKN